VTALVIVEIDTTIAETVTDMMTGESVIATTTDETDMMIDDAAAHVTDIDKFNLTLPIATSYQHYLESARNKKFQKVIKPKFRVEFNYGMKQQEVQANIRYFLYKFSQVCQKVSIHNKVPLFIHIFYTFVQRTAQKLPESNCLNKCVKNV